MNMNEFILEEKTLVKERLKSYEGLMAQGNGYFSVRASFEEGLADALQNERYDRRFESVTTETQRHPLSKFGVYLPTIMGRHPALNEVIINLPYFMEFVFFLDGERVDMLQSDISGYSRSLCMEDGRLRRRFVFTSKTGCKIQFVFSRFAHMENRNLFVQQVRYQVLAGCGMLSLVSGIDANVTTNGYNHFIDTHTTGDTNGISLDTETDLQFKTHMYSALRAQNPVAFCILQSDRHISYTAEYPVKAGDENTFLKLSGLCCSRDVAYDPKAAENAVRRAEKYGYETLLAQSAAVWKTKWDFHDVCVTGNDPLQFALRFSIYHLLRACNEQENRTQICAKGFSGEAYYGRYFWDTEIYMLPFYIYTNPKAAKNLLLYRYHTLDGARENARRYFAAGARYPWQSGLTGSEQCDLWQYADNEVHITADVAYGLMHYYKATDDFAFMAEYGVEILLETARFWVSRVDLNQAGGYDILNAMGPDEYSPMSRNNLYTNRMVKFNLQSAVEMAAELRSRTPKVYAALIKKLGFFENELRRFAEVAEKIVLPYDQERKLWLQSEDFESLADMDIAGLWKDKSKAFGHFAHQEKIYRSKCIKQADVIALFALFPNEFSKEEMETAYDYYIPYTTHDSSLSPACHGLTAIRLGRLSDALAFAQQAVAVDLDIARKGAEDGIHIANCGCLWQLAVNGLAGVGTAMDSQEPEAKPALGEQIVSIRFKILWKGVETEVFVTNDQVTLTNRRRRDK